ncbi:hypothetical protein BFP72_14300 [Reichenbachiella sp. 5M10]|nr:hypothetical protein BFP72_14300 [Reichenbachiella sp. 5M10]
MFSYSDKSEAEMAVEIESTVADYLTRIDAVVTTIDSGVVLNLPKDIDYFVYNVRGDVLFWSDNSFIPPFEFFPFRTSDHIIVNEQGEFLYKKERILWGQQEAYAVVMTKIRRKYNQSSTYLADVYNRNIIRHNINITEDPNSIPIKYEGDTLFNIECSGNTFYNERVNALITGLLFVLLLSVVLLVFQGSYWVNRRFGFLAGFGSLLVWLMAMRMVMYVLVLPSTFVKLSVFEQSVFTYNWFYFTLGDSIINFSALALLMMFAILYGRSMISRLSSRWIMAMGVVMLFLTYFTLFVLLNSISLLLSHSQISLDIASTMDFNLERASAYALIGLLAILFFGVHYLAYQILSQLHASKRELNTLQVICGLVSSVLFFWESNFLLAFGLNVIYILGLYTFDMPQSLKTLKFDSINYLLFTVVLISIGGAFEIYKSHDRNELYRMQKFATYLQVDRDVEGEYLLSNILSQIRQDIIVNSKMMNPQSQLRSIERKIQRTYLNTYFSDYEIDIYLFDKEGVGMSKKYKGLSIGQVKRRYSADEYQTSYENIYYDRHMDINKRKRYICFTNVERYGDINGYVEIELSLKKFSSRRVLPQLLMDRSIRSSSSFDYAMITNGEFLYVSGDYPYESDFDMEWLENESIYDRGLERKGYLHLAGAVGGKVTVVSAPLYKTRDVVSNFSFLFIFLLAITSVISGGRYLSSGMDTKLSFSTKILIFTGGSFVIPLVLVAVAILSSTDSSYRKEIDKSNLKRTLLLAENLNDNFFEFEIQKSTREELENSVAELATNASMDINVYDTNGKMMASSTPEIFESGIISEYMSPKALKSLVQEKKEQIALQEKIGTFVYKTIYVSIYSPDDGSVLGYLAAPYFGSRNHLESQQLIVFSNIIIIFSFVFMISVGIAYYVISRLTKPIMIIADRLHDTGFVQENQPIDWVSDDEIGVLVQEYNNMLGKLEATKAELARTEKEAAWREMAKQVAHEIKNPLTPMKLTIQHLHRILGPDKDKKSLEILLSQIDTLDEIVTSFSHFAKMPTPIKEPFDIDQVLEKSVDLHVDKNIKLSIEEVSCQVLGDKKLFGRIFNNLILNAFQAMKNLEDPELQVSLKSSATDVLIYFKDRGEGIPEEIREKVFIPNFSTKETGSGIGLAVAKRGIEHAGGNIWFESEAGKGTIFFIRMDKYQPVE